VSRITRVVRWNRRTPSSCSSYKIRRLTAEGVTPPVILESLFVFLHVSGATGLLATIAVEGACLGLLARAQSIREARAVLRPLSVAWLVAPVTMLTTLGSGAWLMSRGWGPQPWIFTGLAALTAKGVDGFRNRRRLAPLRRALESSPAPEGALPAHHRPGPPWLRAGLGLAALAVMTFRPGALGSVGILVACMILGVLASAVTSSPGQQTTVATTAVPHPSRREDAGA
jgi:hypothetical protein